MGGWTTIGHAGAKVVEEPQGVEVGVSQAQVESSSGIQTVKSVAENVGSFLSGIRATFRQDNVHVESEKRLQKSASLSRTKPT